MDTRLIGDIHGKLSQYERIANESPGRSVQIGDFGFGFFTPQGDDFAREILSEGRHEFIRGNHDNPEKCRSIPGFITDGTVKTIGSTTVMFIGGAWSIDQRLRTEGVSWWRDEECSYEEFSEFLNFFVDAKPSLVVSHDCPNGVANEMFFKGLQEKAMPTRTSQALERMLDEHEPDLWVFGHWHIDKSLRYRGGTDFLCLGELSYVDLKL